MDLFDAIAKRHCYRETYLPEPIPAAHLRKIAEAALQAPSGCNRQTTRFVVVDAKALITDLARILEKPKLETAPAMILFTCETGSEYTVEDCSAAVQNALLALTALGYVSCWYDGALRREGRAGRIADLLGIPAPHAPRVLLPVGKAASPLNPPEKKPFRERVFLNTFKNPL